MNFEPNYERPDYNFAAYHLQTGLYDREYQVYGMDKSKRQYLKHLYTKMTDDTKKPFRIMTAFNLFKNSGIAVPPFDFTSNFQVIKTEELETKASLIELKNQFNRRLFLVDNLIPEQHQAQPQVQLQISPLKLSKRKPVSLKLKEKSEARNLLTPEDVQNETIYQFPFETVLPQSPPVPPQVPQQEQIPVPNQLIYQDSQYQVIRQQPTQQPSPSGRGRSIAESSRMFLQYRKESRSRSKDEQFRRK